MTENDINVAQVDCDVRAEVVAANLVENTGLSIDKIAISYNGNKKRRYRKDILKVEKRTGKISGQEYVSLDVSRSGIYDLLPQSVFHFPSAPKKNKTIEDVVSEFQRNREEENSIRLFFSPVEQELGRIGILTEIAERSTMFNIADKYSDDLFLLLFPDLFYLDRAYWPALMQLMPAVHRVRGDIELIARLCEAMFKVPARAKNLKQFTAIKNESGSNHLGSSHLGQNFVIGNYIPDYSPEFELEIGPLDRPEVSKFLPGEEFDNIITFISKYLIPFDSGIKMTYIFHKSQKGIYLSGSDNSDRIGLTTYL